MTSNTRNPGSSARSTNLKFVALIALIVAAFVMGGGARHDIISLAVLRPVAILLGAAAVILWARGNPLQIARAPLLGLMAFAILLLLQLFPLPPGLWRLLPGHDVIAQIEDAAGMTGRWRPLSLAPSRTLNTLLSLSIPAAMLLLLAAQSQDVYRRIVHTFVILGGVSAVLGVLQLAGGQNSALYFYDVINKGYPVGLFTNRNHQAIFMVCLIPMLAWVAVRAFARKTSRDSVSPGFVMAACIGLLLLIWTIVILAGSRGGLLLAVVAMPMAVWVVRPEMNALTANHRSGRSKHASKNSFFDKLRTSGKVKWGLAMGASLLVGIFVVGILLQTDTVTTNRLATGEVDTEFRVRIFGPSVELMQTYFPWGTGFGAYDAVFRAVEPTDMVGPSYVNHAHNDWLQIIIEGGIPALLIALAMLAWLGVRTLQVMRSTSEGASRERLAVAVLAILLIASAYDYALRTPAIMVVAAFFAFSLCRPSVILRQPNRSN